MSLAIDTDRVTRVLLADRWHTVKKTGGGQSSFDVDAYEFTVDGGSNYVSGGAVGNVGYTFIDYDTGDRLSGPLSAIMGVETFEPATRRRTRV